MSELLNSENAGSSSPTEEKPTTPETQNDLPEEPLEAEKITKKIDVEQSLVGRIIGRGGETIKYLQQQTSCNIQIDQNFPEGMPRKVVFTGTAEQVEAGEKMVQDVIENGPPEIGPPPGETWITELVDCDQSVVGRVIGRGGEVIKDLQSRTNTRMQVDQSMPAGEPRKVVITGTKANVAAAVGLVGKVMAGEPVGVGPAGPNARRLDCPKHLVGRVIGRGGEVIRQLQALSGARVRVDQQVPAGQACRVLVSGHDPHAVHYAAQLVHDVMAHGPQTLRYLQGGPAGPAGAGPYGAAGAGGYGAAAAAAAAAAAGGYPGYGGGGGGGYAHQAAAGYGQPGFLGGQGGGGRGGGGGGGAGGPGAAGGGEWSEHKMPDGTPYWYNSATGTSQWEKPAGLP